MERNFEKDYIEINVARINGEEQEISLTISSDFTGSNRKSQLYVNEDRLAREVERFWKSIKTKKLVAMNVSFGEVDWYDDEVDVYHTPSVSIKRGLKRARVGYHSHGSVPKEWSFDFTARFKDTSTSTPIMEVVKAALGHKFDAKMEKELKKVLKPLLQKTQKYANVYAEEAEY